ncbi:uncharacterized protein LOC106171815 [Lingula anatina]|uniref:Uncharacterized protein LOC106171815 n=1 Tax=Lingula anatina TaxID=7574 RepID=A0A1S3JC28_LINAN|nr:uncharacterized protein LOC106171815 [Lingula anatina]|eukprot:XP_013407741.1 uncharacterized protein LOC106171815 [Lingula anatina]
MAAKIYPENLDAKVVKTWQDGEQTWVAWTLKHTMYLTKDSLLKLYNHTMELRIWDTKDKLGMRARYDRPKAFKLPTAKPGTSPDDIGGVKQLVMKQSNNYLKLQPKKLYLDRPLPSQPELRAEWRESRLMKMEKEKNRKNKAARDREQGKDQQQPVQATGKVELSVTRAASPANTNTSAVTPSVPVPQQGAAPTTQAGTPGTPYTLVSVKNEETKEDENQEMRSYSRLGRLAGVDSPSAAKELKKQSPKKPRGRVSKSGHAGEKEEPKGQTRMSRSQSLPPPDMKKDRAASSSLSPSGRREGPSSAQSSHKTQGKSVAGSDNGTAAPKSPATVATTAISKDSKEGEAPKRRRTKKAEAEAAAAELARKFGICCVPVRMAILFGGMKSLTNRIGTPVPGVEDLFFTVTVDGPLMSEEQHRALNPMIIKVHSATNMPETPLTYSQLKQKCDPAYIKYQFYKQPWHLSVGREQGKSIYWDDLNVVLLGTIPPCELRELLNGPPLEIGVHDRDRIIEKEKLKATLFGDDLEDEKINSVGAVSGRRTLFNPLKGRPKPWDPYAVGKFDLSELLLGERVMNLKVPLHNCPPPDLLGMKNTEEGKVFGVEGAVDGPVDTPLPVGHYLQSHAMLKVRFELAYPLVTPSELAAKGELETAFECPFGRIVFIFDYKNVQFLRKLQTLVTDINARALELDTMPQHVIDAALSTYKLSLGQQRSRHLDIVTGFQLMDGVFHLFVLEGLKDGAIQQLWEALPKPENAEIEVLFNSDLAFKERLYGPLDVDLCRVKLHEPLSVIMQQPLLYVRDMVPKPCFEALVKLDELTRMKMLRTAVRNDLFPNAEMIVSMSREFGVPLTADDLADLGEETQDKVAEDHHDMANDHEAADQPKSRSRYWPPLDNYNMTYMEVVEERNMLGSHHDYVRENIISTRQTSERNRSLRTRSKPPTVRANVQVAHNYSTQSLNSTELAKEKLRQELSKSADHRFTYCQDYNHSMTVVPVSVEAVKRQETVDSKAAWRTARGFTFPGVNNLRMCNQHPKKPDVARVDELTEPWRENTMHTNVLDPTLDRDTYPWHKRREDLDIWRKPLPHFGHIFPVTIHQAGDKLHEEQREAAKIDQEKWRSRIVIDDPRFYLHRCNTVTEQKDAGPKSNNQIAKLQGLLKDEPKKFSLRKDPMRLHDVPPLNVVLNPSVDTAKREAGLPIVPAVDGEFEERVNGFMPGPYEEHSWLLERNKIPVRDYEHHKFNLRKGGDFNVYHKEKSALSKRKLVPLTEKEKDNNLFQSLDERLLLQQQTMFSDSGDMGLAPSYRSYPLRVEVQEPTDLTEKMEKLNSTLTQKTDDSKVALEAT